MRNILDSVCCVDSCVKKVFCRQWCQTHYNRGLRDGTISKLVRVRSFGRCTVDGCERELKCRERCSFHYRKALKTGDIVRERPIIKSCEVDGCGNAVKGRAQCDMHYKQGEGKCSVESCRRGSFAYGFCHIHYMRWKRHGDPEAGQEFWIDLDETVPEGFRLCRQCRKVKPESDYYTVTYKNGGTKLHSWCKPCTNAYNSTDEYRANARMRRIQKKYGLSVEEYEALLLAKCQVCGRAEAQEDGRNGQSRRLHIDHDHETGKVRGALCHWCNCSLGMLNEDPERIRALADYIERHQRSG